MRTHWMQIACFTFQIIVFKYLDFRVLHFYLKHCSNFNVGLTPELSGTVLNTYGTISLSLIIWICRVALKYWLNYTSAKFPSPQKNQTTLVEIECRLLENVIVKCTLSILTRSVKRYLDQNKIKTYQTI